MRIQVGLAFVIVAGCSAAARPPVPTATREPSIDAPRVVDAGTAEKVETVEKPEEPLAWGTRPPATGPFYPVIEGDCAQADVAPLDDGNAIFSYGLRGVTIARFTDGGLVDVGQTKPPNAMNESVIYELHGSWPEPLLALTSDREGTRVRSYNTLWAHRADGWVSIISHRDPQGPWGGPEISGGSFLRGNAIFQRHQGGSGGLYERSGTVEATPVVAGATKLTGVAALRRPDMIATELATGTEEIYLLGRIELPQDPNGNLPTQFAQILHVWRDGKVREVKLPPGTADRTILETKPNLVVVSRKREIRRLVEGDQWEPVPFDVGPNDEVLSLTTAPDGSTWAVVNPGQRNFRRDASGKTEEIKPPGTPVVAPDPRSRDGTNIRGIAQGDPWARSADGTLSHFVSGKWEVVPTAPLRVYAPDVVAKGDVYVVGTIQEKLPGWSRASTRTQVLRTKRPKEILRCNEAIPGTPNGHGFMSFPPRATAECKTPFVVLLRTAYATSASKPKVIFDAKADFKEVREALKGEATELVEIASGEQRYLGFVPASVDAGHRAIEAVAKKMKATPDFRPEIVCGVPPAIVRTIKLAP